MELSPLLLSSSNDPTGQDLVGGQFSSMRGDYGGSQAGSRKSQYDPNQSVGSQSEAGGGAFLFDQSLLKGTSQGISFKMTIYDIDLINLKNAHSLSKNSPYVSVACGKWSNATMPLMNAGSTAFWTRLGWKFNMKGSANLRIVVNSKDVIIGTAAFNADKLIDTKCDVEGVRRIMAEISIDGKTPSGKVKVSFALQAVQDVMPGIVYIDTLYTLYTLYTLPPPYTHYTGSGSLPNLHSSSASVASTGNISKTNSISKAPQPLRLGLGSSSDYNASTHSDSASKSVPMFNTTPVVKSAYMPSGSTIPNKQQYNGAMGDATPNHLYYNNQANERSNYQEQEHEPQTPYMSQSAPYMSMDRNSSSMGSIGKTSQQQQERPSSAFQRNSFTLPHTIPELIDDGRVDDDELTKDDMDDMDVLDMPVFSLTVLEIQAVELRTVHKFGRNNPCIKLLCENTYKVTDINTEGTDICFWKDLNWTVTVSNDSVLKLGSSSVVTSLLGETSADIGSASIVCSKLKNIPRNRMGHREVVFALMQGGIYSGKLRMIIRLRPGEIDYDEPNTMERPRSSSMPQLTPTLSNKKMGISRETSASRYEPNNSRQSQQQPQQKSMSRVKSEGTIQNKQQLETQSEMSVSIAPSKASRFSKMNVSAMNLTVADNFSQPCKVTIKAISVIDLTNVHTFSSNSPCVNLACGKFQARTAEKEGAGHHASWDVLDLPFFFDKKSVLRVLVTSKHTNIGMCNIKRSKILSSKKGKTGLFTVFAELEKSPSVSSGKLKIQYNLVLPGS